MPSQFSEAKTQYQKLKGKKLIVEHLMAEIDRQFIGDKNSKPPHYLVDEEGGAAVPREVFNSVVMDILHPALIQIQDEINSLDSSSIQAKRKEI